MTLTEFLLARIAEDESVARECIREYERESTRSPHAELWTRVESTTWGVGDYVHMVGVSAARLLAECEFKRRLIGEPEHRGGVVYNAQLLWMADVYADHPDHRDEWRARPMVTE